jgi:hypothetical protein
MHCQIIIEPESLERLIYYTQFDYLFIAVWQLAMISLIIVQYARICPERQCYYYALNTGLAL